MIRAISSRLLVLFHNGVAVSPTLESEMEETRSANLLLSIISSISPIRLCISSKTIKSIFFKDFEFISNSSMIFPSTPLSSVKRAFPLSYEDIYTSKPLSSPSSHLLREMPFLAFPHLIPNPWNKTSFHLSTSCAGHRTRALEILP